ncbi:hypothetical protein RFI_28154, partial [Reticulomyxa filosa]
TKLNVLMSKPPPTGFVSLSLSLDIIIIIIIIIIINKCFNPFTLQELVSSEIVEFEKSGYEVDDDGYAVLRRVSSEKKAQSDEEKGQHGEKENENENKKEKKDKDKEKEKKKKKNKGKTKRKKHRPQTIPIKAPKALPKKLGRGRGRGRRRRRRRNPVYLAIFQKKIHKRTFSKKDLSKIANALKELEGELGNDREPKELNSDEENGLE